MHGLFRIPGVIVLSRLCANIFLSIVADGVMFHYADASRSFGDLQSASTVVPLSDLFDDQFIEGRGVGFQFQSSDPDEAGLVSDPNSNDLTDGSFVQAKL